MWLLYYTFAVHRNCPQEHLARKTAWRMWLLSSVFYVFCVVEQFYQSWFPPAFPGCSLDQASSPGIYNTNSSVDIRPIVQGKTGVGYLMKMEKKKNWRSSLSLMQIYTASSHSRENNCWLCKDEGKGWRWRRNGGAVSVLYKCIMPWATPSSHVCWYCMSCLMSNCATLSKAC